MSSERGCALFIEYHFYYVIIRRYASLVSFNGQLLHGQLSESKAKAKTSAALVLATKFVNIGWVDLDKMPKKAPKKAAPNKTTTKRKRVAEDSMDVRF